jgi:DNA-binding IclR family transcriptional regulator
LQKLFLVMKNSKSEMPQPPNYSVPALERGLDILEALGSVAVPQSLTDLGTRLDRSASALFRVLNCLERRHYVTRDPVSGKYALSLKLFALAHTHSPVEALLRAARLPMQALAEELGESCHLSVLERGRLLVIAQHDSPEPVRVSIEVGGLFDPVATASGRLLLALLPAAVRVGVLASCPAWEKLGPAARGALESRLAEIAAAGLSTSRDETIEGLEDFAVPVGRAEVPFAFAALAITRFRRSGAADRGTVLESRLRATAAAISTALGLSSSLSP